MDFLEDSYLNVLFQILRSVIAYFFGGLLLLPPPDGLPVVLGIRSGYGLPFLIVVLAILLLIFNVIFLLHVNDNIHHCSDSFGLNDCPNPLEYVPHHYSKT